VKVRILGKLRRSDLGSEDNPVTALTHCSHRKEKALASHFTAVHVDPPLVRSARACSISSAMVYVGAPDALTEEAVAGVLMTLH
jgi:hypothetical protein